MKFETRKSYYHIDGDFFILIPKNKENLNIILNKKDEIIEYSNRDNKIIEIVDIDTDKIITKYYKDWYPLVITDLCSIFYDEKTIKNRSKVYNNFIKKTDRVKEFYKNIVGEYENFEKNINLQFNDMTSNNILVNSDISDFRIIDVNSISQVNKLGKLGSPNIKYILGYYSYQYITKDFFDKDYVDKIFEEINE